jgi:GDPmannose 4,6-dehydratase
MPSALITGITGQDGSYLTELLLSKGYTVHGLVRRSSNTVRLRLDHLTSDPSVYNRTLFLHYADLDDITTVRRLLIKISPEEVYHLAGQTHVGASFDIPESTCEFTAMGTLRLLEILRDIQPRPRFLHASSSEIFGRPDQWPQTEATAFNPVTPYGVAKAFATQMVKVYRQAFGFYACNAICYNHESPRRGESFVTRKITRSVAQIKHGLQNRLLLGNLQARRDWGFAGDYVDAMWRMLQQDNADDYIVATGEDHTVADFLEIAFGQVGLDYRQYVSVDPKFFRPTDVERLVGNPAHAERMLQWAPATRFPDLVKMMVQSDLDAIVAN